MSSLKRNVRCDSCGWSMVQSGNGFSSCALCGSALPLLSPSPPPPQVATATKPKPPPPQSPAPSLATSQASISTDDANLLLDLLSVDLTKDPPDNGEGAVSDASTRKAIEIISDSDSDKEDVKKPPAKSYPRNSKILALDAQLARKIQEQEQQEVQERKEKEQKAMYQGEFGRAFLLVEKVLQVYHKILNDSPTSANLLETAQKGKLCSVGKDDMVYLAEKMMKCQAKFKSANKPIQVEIAYHYTQQERLHGIRQDGLLTQQTLTRPGARHGSRHGAHFGNGIYVGNNPYAFRPYGDTGLLVAILKGKQQRLANKEERAAITNDSGVDTVIGNKRSNKEVGFDEIVLFQSCQVLPLIRFSKELVHLCASLLNPGNELLWRFHVEMQKLLDDFFQNPTPVEPRHVVPSAMAMKKLANSFAKRRQIATLPLAVTAIRQNPHAFVNTMKTHLQIHDQDMRKKVKEFLKAQSSARAKKGVVLEQLRNLVGDVHWNKVCQVYAAQLKANPAILRQLQTGTGPITGEPVVPTVNGTQQQQQRQQQQPQQRQPLASVGRPTSGSTHAGLPVPSPTTQQRQQQLSSSLALAFIQRNPDAFARKMMAYLGAHDPAMQVKVRELLRAESTTRSKKSLDLDKLQKLVGVDDWNKVFQVFDTFYQANPQSSVASLGQQVVTHGGPPTVNGTQQQQGPAQQQQHPLASVACNASISTHAGLPVSSFSTPQKQQPPPAAGAVSFARMPAAGAPTTNGTSLNQQTPPRTISIIRAVPPPPSKQQQLTSSRADNRKRPRAEPQQPQPPRKKRKDHPGYRERKSQMEFVAALADELAQTATSTTHSLAVRRSIRVPEDQRGAAQDLKMMMTLASTEQPKLATRSNLTLKQHGQAQSPIAAMEVQQRDGIATQTSNAATTSAKAPLQPTARGESSAPASVQLLVRASSASKPAARSARRVSFAGNVHPAKTPATPIPAPTPAPTPVPTQAARSARRVTIVSDDPTIYTGTIFYQAPATLQPSFERVASLSGVEDCLLCSKSLFHNGKVVRLNRCSHKFHLKCIEALVKDDSVLRCPTCLKPTGEPQGKSPSGTMKVEVTHKVCFNYEPCKGSFVIHYSLPGGTQETYHVAPGVAYEGTSRKAYVPNNEQGKKLLRRLKYAWSKGLIFSIGTSQTTGKSNSIVWGSVPHKTSRKPGRFGFPDPSYFERCHEALDRLGVPKSAELCYDGSLVRQAGGVGGG